MMVSKNTLCFRLLAPFLFHVVAYHPVSWQARTQRMQLLAGKKNIEGYSFGDVTRGFLRKGAEKINEITGKEGEYEFGDLSRYLDAKAKKRVLMARKSNATSTTDDEYFYQFGDLSRWVSHLLQERATGFTGEEKYRLGDITKTIVRRVQTGEYCIDDIYLALRVLVAAGIPILPVTNALPLKMLLQLVEADLAKDIGARLTESVAASLDARFKQALTGKSDYQLGDMTKDRLRQQLAKFTGKDQYEFGDIVRALSKSKDVQPLSAALQALSEQAIADWDERYLAANSTNSTKVA